MPKINDFLQGFQDGLPGMKDFRHASRLYLDNNYKLMPKQKFLYHVYFDIDDTVAINKFDASERYALNMLVKQCDLPRYNMNYEEKIQYNKKMYANTRIVYEPVVITFHDDHADTVNAFWKKYYEYEIADPVNLTDLAQQASKDDYYTNGESKQMKWGLDTPKQSKKPFLRGIQIFVLHQQRFTSFQLINPVIGSFNHDSLDNADGTGILQNQMQVLYETVVYGSGTVGQLKGEKGFAQLHYDNEPSPLTVLGGGTNSIFGPGGVVDGIGSVIDNAQRGNILGAILAASNTYNNAKKIKKSDAKSELKGLAKKGVLETAKQVGNTTNPVAQFAVGSALLLNANAEATARGTSDNQSGQNNTRLTNLDIDTTQFLSPDESFNLVTNNDTIKDELAAGIYYKDIGSRKGLSIDASNIEFEGSSDTVKNVYRQKTVTDVRKLVTEGYIRIARNTQDVNVTVERANI